MILGGKLDVTLSVSRIRLRQPRSCKGSAASHGLRNTAITVSGLCNHVVECMDSSDEIDCVCPSNQFTCRCFHTASSVNPSAQEKCNKYYDWYCIPMDSVNNGVYDCPDGSDEFQFQRTVQCEHCKVTMLRLSNQHQCNDVNSSCNNATCFETPHLTCDPVICDDVDMICISDHECQTTTSRGCRTALQCSDGTLILASQFCDGNIDCPDNSDEATDQLGFKCLKSDSCVLPQPNLYDDFAHCLDNSDLCNESNCFECFDKCLLISSKQVCDGAIDCYDLSDECLCQTNFDKVFCDALFTSSNDSIKQFCKENAQVNPINPDTIITIIHWKYTLATINDQDINALLGATPRKSLVNHCETKHGYTTAIFCDGRPECRDFSDECSCQNRPTYCNDSCRFHYNFFYPIGEFYCDGFEDEFAWKYLNETACPYRFDEKSCPNRFKCKAGGKVSIDSSQVCNGVIDCDNGDDENNQNCPVHHSYSNLFSSDTELIANPIIKSAFWIIGVVVVLGNLIVILEKAKYLKSSTGTLTDSLRCQHLIILNISFADFIMGIYLLAIAFYSAFFSGYYGQVDREWRSSFRCSIIGSLAVISSETSCFLLVILTAFRLHTTRKPMSTITLSTRPWKVSICIAWLLSFTFGLLPTPSKHIKYFVHSIFFNSAFNKQGLWNITSLTKFACRFAAMTGQTIEREGIEWYSVQKYLEDNFSNHSSLFEFGYYGETSICMPRIYVEQGESAWEYTLALIALNFTCFSAITACYIYLFVTTNKKSTILTECKNVNRNKLRKQENKMRKRIAILIATDFCCWVPICIMSFVRIRGVEFPIFVYQISAVFLLPINSALNPFLYSLLPDILRKKLKFKKNKQKHKRCVNNHELRKL